VGYDKLLLHEQILDTTHHPRLMIQNIWCSIYLGLHQTVAKEELE